MNERSFVPSSPRRLAQVCLFATAISSSRPSWGSETSRARPAGPAADEAAPASAPPSSGQFPMPEPAGPTAGSAAPPSPGGPSKLPRDAGPAAGASASTSAPPSPTQFSMAEPAQEVHDTKTRWAGVPIIGGNSDFGWGGGALLSVVRPNSRNLKSNEWSAEMAAVAMVGADRLEPRYQDYYLRATFDDVFQTGVKLTLRPSFTQLSGVNYYGLGNASRRGGPGFPDPDGPERAFFDYARAEGTLRATFGHDFSHHIRLETGMMWSAVQMEVPEDSRLAYDAREGPSEVRSRLNGLNNHLFGAFTWSLEIDTRDEEVNPHRGIYQTTTFTFAPGGAGEFNPTWGRGFAALRVYQGFFGGGWVLAARAMVDALVGDPPVYELSRFDNFSNAFGGEKGVRGIEAQRYYGKVKAIANLESRIALFRFRLLGQQNTVIFNQFFDFGRLWTDFDGSRALDGAGLGLKYSVGGGLRVLFQDSFVVAFDVGWSPDAAPLGVYLTSGHAF